MRAALAIACGLLAVSCSLMWDLDPDRLPIEDGTTEDTTGPDGTDAAPDLPVDSLIDLPEAVSDTAEDPGVDATSGLCTLIEESRITFTPEQPSAVALDWTGENYGLLWHHEGTPGGVRFVEIAPDGTPVDDPAEITTGYMPSALSNPDMVWTGSQHAAIWATSEFQIRMIRFASDGTPAGTTNPVTSGLPEPATFARSVRFEWTGSEFGMAWLTLSGTAYEIEFARIDEDGAMIGSASTVVTHETTMRHDHEMTWTGSEFGLAWIDERDGNQEIYFTRVGADGMEIGDDSRMTSNLDISAAPTLAWTGSEYALLWRDMGDGGSVLPVVNLARLHPGGTIVDTVDAWGSGIAGSFIPAALGWSGSEIMISFFMNEKVQAARFGPLLERRGGDLIVRDLSGILYGGCWGQWTGTEFGLAYSYTSYSQTDLFFIRAGFCE